MAGTRERLLEAGLRVLRLSGPDALNARRLAAEIGSSTMTVYTQFGGMAGLYEAMVREAFRCLAGRLRGIDRTEDPIADLLTHALAYHGFACEDPRRYRFMFGADGPDVGPLLGHEPDREGGLLTLAEVNAAFSEVDLVGDCVDSGRLRAGNAHVITGQLWSLVHGFVMLDLTGVFGGSRGGVTEVLAPASISLLVGLGDDPVATRRSAATAWQRSGPPRPPSLPAPILTRAPAPPGSSRRTVPSAGDDDRSTAQPAGSRPVRRGRRPQARTASS